MKKLIGYLLSHACYCAGHLCSKTHFLFKGYQWFMHCSSKIQDWAGNKTPWSIPT